MMNQFKTDGQVIKKGNKVGFTQPKKYDVMGKVNNEKKIKFPESPLRLIAVVNCRGFYPIRRYASLWDQNSFLFIDF